MFDGTSNSRHNHSRTKRNKAISVHDDVIKWKNFPRYWPFVRGIHRFPVNSPQRPVTGSFDVFFDVRLNKLLSKQSWGWWFETLSRPLWRHRNVSFTETETSLWRNCHYLLRGNFSFCVGHGIHVVCYIWQIIDIIVLLELLLGERVVYLLDRCILKWFLASWNLWFSLINLCIRHYLLRGNFSFCVGHGIHVVCYIWNIIDIIVLLELLLGERVVLLAWSMYTEMVSCFLKPVIFIDQPVYSNCVPGIYQMFDRMAYIAIVFKMGFVGTGTSVGSICKTFIWNSWLVLTDSQLITLNQA